MCVPYKQGVHSLEHLCVQYLVLVKHTKQGGDSVTQRRERKDRKEKSNKYAHHLFVHIMKARFCKGFSYTTVNISIVPL